MYSTTNQKMWWGGIAPETVNQFRDDANAGKTPTSLRESELQRVLSPMIKMGMWSQIPENLHQMMLP